MANFTALKTAINNAIKTNGNEEITGAILQAILDAMVETLGDSAINDLENAITTEITNRENAVGGVADDLAAEVQARQALDYNVNNRINAEEYNRQNADAALSQTMSQEFQTLGSQMTALNAAISALNAAYQNGYLYGGIATPSSSPSNNKCFYIALQGGTYTNFGGVGVVEGINIIKNDSGWKVEHIYDQTTLLNEFYLLRQQVIQAITSFDPIVIEGDVTNAPDEEDLTSNANHLLQFKNNAYSPLEFSGLGRKYLRKNIAPLSESAAFNGFVEGVTAEETLSGTPTQIFWDRMNTRFVGIKDGIYYAAWTDDDNYVPVSTSLVYMYNGTPYQWTGSDFIVDETEVPNLVNCLTQDMINEANTIYIIRYDFTLREDITIPANCVLQFDGGSLSNGTITGNNTGIDAGLVKIFNTDIILAGTWNVDWFYPEWYGAKGDGITDDTVALQKLNGKSIYLQEKTYIASNLEYNSYTSIIGINKFTSCLKQKSNSHGDFIRLIDWFAGRLENIRIQGVSDTTYDETAWMPALLKIANLTYKHNPDAPGGWDETDVSTHFSTINNVVIRNAPKVGLSVLGSGSELGLPEYVHNWVHHISNLWVNHCGEYGIYDSASDNQWELINIAHCGLANLYMVGSAETFINSKLDGESGFACDSTKTPYQILRREYEGAAIIMLGSGCYLDGLDIQSMLYCGIKLEGKNNVIRGTMNNIGLITSTNEQYTQEDTPGIYFYRNRDAIGNIIDFTVFHYVEQYTQMPVRYHDYEYGLITQNQINIRYSPYNFNRGNDYYKRYLKVLDGLQLLGNQIISPIEITNFNEGIYVAYKNSDSNIHYASSLAEYLNEKEHDSENVAPIGIYLCEGDFSFIIGLEDKVGRLGNSDQEVELYGGRFAFEKSGLEATYACSRMNDLPSDSISKVLAQYDPFPNKCKFWYVTSLFELKVIYKHINEINYLLKQVGGSTLDVTSYYGTISKHNDIYINAVNMRNGFVYTYVNWQLLRFRPICRIDKDVVPLFKSSTSDLVNYMNANGRIPKGYSTFNESIGKPVWWNGTDWVDATGAPV